MSEIDEKSSFILTDLYESKKPDLVAFLSNYIDKTTDDYFDIDESMTLTQICKKVTDIDFQIQAEATTPSEPSLIQSNSIVAKTINLKNKIQYCNNLLRYTLIRANIIDYLDNTNKMSELISLLSDIEGYNKIMIGNVYNNLPRTYLHLSTRNNPQSGYNAYYQDNNGLLFQLQDGIYIERYGWSSTAGVELANLPRGSRFKISKMFYSYDHVFDGFLLATDDTTACAFNSFSAKSGEKSIITGGVKTGITNWDYNTWPNNTSLYNFDEASATNVTGKQEQNTWYRFVLEYDGSKITGSLYKKKNEYDSNYLSLIDSYTYNYTLDSEFTVYSLMGYFGSKDGRGNKNINKNFRIYHPTLDH